MTLPLGWRPDPRKTSVEKQDRAYGAIGNVPSSASVRHLLGQPYNQGFLGSCVAQAVAKLVEASHRRQGLTAPEPISRLALYWFCRSLRKEVLYDAGAHLRDAFIVLNRLGFARESDWPYDTYRYIDQPPPRVLRGAYDQSTSSGKPTNYWRIYGDQIDRTALCCAAIANGFPIAFGVDVTTEFASADFAPDGPVDCPTINDAIAGGHAMVLGGYSKDSAGNVVFDVLNSWGDRWVDNGWCQMTSEYACGIGRDHWVAEHSPEYSA